LNKLVMRALWNCAFWTGPLISIIY